MRDPGAFGVGRFDTSSQDAVVSAGTVADLNFIGGPPRLVGPPAVRIPVAFGAGDVFLGDGEVFFQLCLVQIRSVLVVLNLFFLPIRASFFFLPLCASLFFSPYLLSIIFEFSLPPHHQLSLFQMLSVLVLMLYPIQAR